MSTLPNMDRVLVLNAGSSSLKWVVLDAASEHVEGEGSADTEEVQAVVDGVRNVSAVGHRVVHGGARFRDAVVIDDTVRAAIAELGELAPLHNPAALKGIDAAMASLPNLPHIAAFDTAFHASMPEEAALYPVPREWTERWGVRRFGFHGLSVQYAVSRVAELLGGLPSRVIVCHLGAGCSVTAVADGRSVDTSMGFTPLEGVMMARRSGSIDPGLLLYLAERVSLPDLDRGLNAESGLLGVSGRSADMRDLLASEEHDPRARLAIGMFVHRVRASIGAMASVLAGADVVVFTGGIGENSAVIRERVMASLAYLDARTMVVPAREDLAILRELKRLVPL
jgi:acetate kinase